MGYVISTYIYQQTRRVTGGWKVETDPDGTQLRGVGGCSSWDTRYRHVLIMRYGRNSQMG